MWRVTAAGRNVRIEYSLDWLAAVMAVSAPAPSMVPFTTFSLEMGVKDRSYPRSFSPGFILAKQDREDASPSAGGRQHADYTRIAELCEQFGPGTEGLPVPLSDIAILSKRAVCLEVLRKFRGSSNFKVEGGTPLLPGDAGCPGWPIHGYPMLCVTGPSGSTVFPSTQAEWRAVQCVFGAALTRFVRERRIGIEVVSREGFGSVFPTLADIPDGIRLDPGLLPPDAGAAAICEALAFTHAFIVEMRKQKLPKAIGDLGGYDGSALGAVDRLMSVLQELALSSLDPSTFAKRVAGWNGSGSDSCVLPPVEGGVEYELADVLSVDEWPRLRRRHEPEADSGYGSESDWEDEDPGALDEDDGRESGWQKFKRLSGDDEDDVSVRGRFAIKKVSVLSGMAALRMATYYGMMYSQGLFGATGPLKGTEESGSTSIHTWAPYFELNHEELRKLLGPLTGVRVLVFDGAPNPINIPAEGPIALPRKLGAIVIDTTNCTSMEKARYLAYFRKHLANPEDGEAAGGLLLMVDSASKHPTGGDLVHGVMRVCGRRPSVERFKQFLGKHLKLKKELAYGLTALSPPETEARRMMIATRLVMRNRDFWQALAAL